MIVQDLRFALRQLWVAPGYCAAVIFTLALGIGANTAVFSLLDAFLLRPLPYAHAERIAALVQRQQAEGGSDQDDSFDGETWNRLKQNVDSLQFASHGGTGGVNFKAQNGGVQYVLGERVSAEYFSVLGIPLRVGREFTADEDRPKGPLAVVISDRLWSGALHSDENILGKSILLKGEPHTVVGVLAANAVTPSNADVFTPLRPAPTGECGGNNCGIFVRLKPGATWEQAAAEVKRVRTRQFDEFEKQFHGHMWIEPLPLRRELAGDQREQVMVLMVAVGFILLIACANLAGLTLVRLSRRASEIATRLALGASSWAVLRQLWIETLALSVIGAAVGVALAFVMVEGLATLLPRTMQPVGGFAVDLRALPFTLAVSLMTSVVCGALPAMQAWRLDLRGSIAGGSRAILGGSSRLRQWLIGSEVALTVVLLAASGLLVRTLVHLETRSPGFDPHGVMTAKVSLDDVRFHDAGAFQGLIRKSVESMRESVGTNEVAFALSMPYERGLNDGVSLLDGPRKGAQDSASMAYVTPEFFSTLRIPLLAGRLLTEADNASAGPVVVVNDSFAKRFAPGTSILGVHFKSGKETYMVVGVVGDVMKKPGLEGSAPLKTERTFYMPAAQVPQGLANGAHIWFQPSWAVRAPRLDEATTIHRMQQALAKIMPDLPFSGFYSMDQLLAEQLERQRIEVTLLGSLALLALILSAVGLYALVSFSVVQRRRELGIRMVLGSTVGEAMFDVGKAGAVATALGLAAGVALSFAALRVLESQIFGVSVYDPVTLLGVTLLLAAIGALAIFIPSLRISRLQPAETLREQ